MPTDYENDCISMCCSVLSKTDCLARLFPQFADLATHADIVFTTMMSTGVTTEYEDVLISIQDEYVKAHAEAHKQNPYFANLAAVLAYAEWLTFEGLCRRSVDPMWYHEIGGRVCNMAYQLQHIDKPMADRLTIYGLALSNCATECVTNDRTYWAFRGPPPSNVWLDDLQAFMYNIWLTAIFECRKYAIMY